MKIALVNTFSVDFDKTTKGEEIVGLEKQMNLFFNNKEYGDSICTYLIGINCVHPKFDEFFTARKPVYIEDKKITIEKAFGETHIYKHLTFTIKLDFTNYYNSDKEEGFRIVANAIVETIRNLKYPAKIKDFDKDRFFSDLTLFFKEEGII